MIFGICGFAHIVVGVVRVGHRIAKIEFLALCVLNDCRRIVLGICNVCGHLRKETIAFKQDRFCVFGVVGCHLVEFFHALVVEFEENVDDETVTSIVCGMIIGLV